MSLTGITWLTGEVVDQTRLNYQVGNTSYLKTLFSSISPYSSTSWTATAWSDVSAWSTGQIIDETRLNQMHTNQSVLRSVVDVHTVWNFPEEHYWSRTVPLDRYGNSIYNQIFLEANDVKFGSNLVLPTNDGVWNTMKLSNMPLDGYPDYEVIKLGFYFGDMRTNYMARFAKIPEMKYLSFSVKVAKTIGGGSYNWKELVVKAHRTFTNW
jgi:hypothetical protein